MVCLNARLRSERARKREALLLKTEQALEAIARSARPLAKRIARKVGGSQSLEDGQAFWIHITEGGSAWRRRLRLKRSGWNLCDSNQCEGHRGVRQFALTRVFVVERAFRSKVKNVRPIYVYSADHGRMCFCACCLRGMAHATEAGAAIILTTRSRLKIGARRRSRKLRFPNQVGPETNSGRSYGAQFCDVA